MEKQVPQCLFSVRKNGKKEDLNCLRLEFKKQLRNL